MKIRLVQADSNEFLNVTDATNAMERLMTKDKVDFVLGGFRSETVLAMQDIAMRVNMVARLYETPSLKKGVQAK